MTNRTPTIAQLKALPYVAPGKYKLSDTEVRTLRSRIYSLHKENAAGWRWATRRVGDYLIIWRIG
jgi:hypothetical protein